MRSRQLGRARRFGLFAIAACAVGCAMPPYQPSVVELGLPAGRSLTPAEFRLAGEALRAQYPSLGIDAEQFRMRSDWEPWSDARGWPGRRRIAVFLEDDGALAAVVEISQLSSGWFGDPDWTPSSGHAGFEREALEAMRRALGA